MRRFISPCPPPTPEQLEALTILGEELSEVGQRIAKACRFGLAEIQPGQPHDNKARISQEVGQLLAALDLCYQMGLLDARSIAGDRLAKPHRIAKFAQTRGVHDMALDLAHAYALGACQGIAPPSAIPFCKAGATMPQENYQ